MVIRKAKSGTTTSLSNKNKRLSNSDLSQYIADKHNTTYKKANQIVHDMFDFIASNVKKGKSYNQVGFGTFKKVRLKKRKGYNPKTKSSIVIPAKNKFAFRAGATVKRALNQ